MNKFWQCLSQNKISYKKRLILSENIEIKLFLIKL